jgi:hypothetical protein
MIYSEKVKKIIKNKYPEITSLTERTLRALELYKKLAREARKRGWKIAFLSGLAVDANFGYLTKQHRDADIIASSETIKEIVKFLEREGHNVYEPEKVKGECLKVDQAEPDRPMRAHCDIHYYWEQDGKIIIPLLGKRLSLSAGFYDATVELEFMGEWARFLKPQYILEEKIGWRDQIGLEQREEYTYEMEKVSFLMKELKKE